MSSIRDSYDSSKYYNSIRYYGKPPAYPIRGPWFGTDINGPQINEGSSRTSNHYYHYPYYSYSYY